MLKLKERFHGSIFDVEHETEFSNTDVIIIERTNGNDKTRVELPKNIESGLIMEIIHYSFDSVTNTKASR